MQMTQALFKESHLEVSVKQELLLNRVVIVAQEILDLLQRVVLYLEEELVRLKRS
jgi:hypothetical protein